MAIVGTTGDDDIELTPGDTAQDVDLLGGFDNLSYYFQYADWPQPRPIDGIRYNGSNASYTVNNRDSVHWGIRTEANTVVDVGGYSAAIDNVEHIGGTDGNDILVGAEGEVDEIFRPYGGEDYISGGGGRDLLHYALDYGHSRREVGVRVDLAAGTAIDTLGSTDRFEGIESVRGTMFDDTLTGDGNDNEFQPLGGSDVIDGGDGEDRVSYEFLGSYYEAVGPQPGGIDADLAKGIIIDPTGNQDSVTNIEQIIGTRFGDTIRGDDGTNILDGRDGNDTLTPRNNSDYDKIEGSRGDDTIDYSESTSGSQNLDYRNLDAGIAVTIDGEANIGSVDKGANGRDTIQDIEKPLDLNDFLLQDTDYADAFDIKLEHNQWMSLRLHAGNDVVNVHTDSAGDLRIDYRDAVDRVVADLSTGAVSEDGFGGSDVLQGRIWEVRGSQYADILTASSSGNSLRGDEGDDTLIGGAGNDRLIGGAGDDSINGGSGRDRAVYLDDRDSHQLTLTRGADDQIQVEIVSSASGSDSLTGVERIVFTDGMLAFDAEGNAGQAYRLYQAAFERVPDNEGLSYWTDRLDSGTTSLNAIADSFLHSPEFVGTYGTVDTVSNARFVELLYLHTLGRDYDQEGFEYWVSRLDNNQTNRGDLLAFFSESDENKAQVANAIDEGIWYAYA